jgi:hypothetical protein
MYPNSHESREGKKRGVTGTYRPELAAGLWSGQVFGQIPVAEVPFDPVFLLPPKDVRSAKVSVQNLCFLIRQPMSWHDEDQRTAN